MTEIVNFARTLGLAFQYGESETVIYTIKNNEQNVCHLNFIKSDFHLQTGYFETYHVSGEKEIFERLKEYDLNKKAFYLFNYILFNYRKYEIQKTELPEKIIDELDGNEKFQHYFLMQIVRQGTSRVFYNYLCEFLETTSSGNNLLNYLNKVGGYELISKLQISWEKLVKITNVDERELYFRADNQKFVESIISYALRESDLHDLYIDFCKFVVGSKNLSLSIESMFFNVFEAITGYSNILPTNKTRQKFYYKFSSINSSLELAKAIRRQHEILNSHIAHFTRDLSTTEKILDNEIDKKPNLKNWLEKSLLAWNNLFKYNSQEISESIINYFSNHSNIEPRITIKGVTTHTSKTMLTSLYRNHAPDYPLASNLMDNTGFEFSLFTGHTYLNNNLPACLEAGIYRNPRIHSSNRIAIQKKKHPTINNWIDIWDGGQAKKPNSAYKSTLICPISIPAPGEALIETDVGLKEQRIIGFVCIDHPEENFFYPLTDVEMIQTCAAFYSSYFTSRRSIFLGANLVGKLLQKHSLHNLSLGYTRLGKKIAIKGKQMRIDWEQELHDKSGISDIDAALTSYISSNN